MCNIAKDVQKVLKNKGEETNHELGHHPWFHTLLVFRSHCTY